MIQPYIFSLCEMFFTQAKFGTYFQVLQYEKLGLVLIIYSIKINILGVWTFGLKKLHI